MSYLREYNYIKYEYYIYHIIFFIMNIPLIWKNRIIYEFGKNALIWEQCFETQKL